MPTYQIIKELEKGFCRVLLTADNDESEEQTYPNDPDVLTAAAQHFDAEHKRKDEVANKVEETARLDVQAEKVFEVVDVKENLDA